MAAKATVKTAAAAPKAATNGKKAKAEEPKAAEETVEKTPPPPPPSAPAYKKPSNPDNLPSVLGGAGNNLVSIAQTVNGLVKDYTNEQLKALIAQTDTLEYGGWRIKCAATAEAKRRVDERCKEEGLHNRTEIDALAADLGIDSRTVYNDAKLHNTFFTIREYKSVNKRETTEQITIDDKRANEHYDAEQELLRETEEASEILKSKQYHTLAAAAEKKGKARQALIEMARRKVEDPTGFTTREAQKYVQEQILGKTGEKEEKAPGEGAEGSETADSLFAGVNVSDSTKALIKALIRADVNATETGKRQFIYRTPTGELETFSTPPQDENIPVMTVEASEKYGALPLLTGEFWEEDDEVEAAGDDEGEVIGSADDEEEEAEGDDETPDADEDDF